LLPDESVTLSNGTTVATWTERMRVVDDSVAVLASYDDGATAGGPAITRRPVNGGGATYVASDLGADGIRMLVTQLSDGVPALRGDARAAGGALELIVRADDAAEYTFLINRTDTEVTSPLAAGTTVMDAATPGAVVTVPPRGAVVTRTEPG
jgi:beta-galactosidase